MFIDRLNEALKANKMTGNALCKKMKISNSIYTGWKTNKPHADKLKQIADILNVSIDWLLEREDSIEPIESELLSNFREADERGKSNITNIAELEARRSRKEKTESQENRQPSAAQKIQFPNSEKNSEDELKPFA